MNTPIVVMTEEEVAAFGRREDAGFGALECERGMLPLTAMQIDARVRGVMVALEVAQTFINTTGGAIEATYIFPLPDRLAVNRFRLKVADRVIEGIVDERGAAREQYDEAIAAGHRAAITEEERAGVFTLRVGNLMPGEVATVVLSLVGPLPVDDGEVTFRFPLVVAPRYMPGAALAGEQAGVGEAADTDLVPDASRISPPVRLPGHPNPVRLGLRVSIEDAGLRDLASSLHAVTTTNADARVVELQPGEKLDRDFILRWRIDGRELRSTLVCSDDADGKAGTFMLTLVPPSTATLAAKPRDVVFVIDRSGSMGGWKMVAARRAVGRMIDTLGSRDRFCALAFDTEVEAIPAAMLTAATDRERFRAVEQLGKIEARGGTEMLQPLTEALALFPQAYDDRERVLVLVTDGQVGNEDHILRMLAPNLRGVRMFTLGIDLAVNAAFLRRLASTGGGLCELVESEERLDEVMAKVHRRIGTPIATELVLHVSGLSVDPTEIAPLIAPWLVPDVYAGAPVVVLGRYSGTAPADAEVEVTGTSFGDPFAVKVARTGTGSPDLAASWARARIRDLEDHYAKGRHAAEELIVATSKRFNVLSRFTAFLAIDRAELANRSGRLHQVVQPVEAPAGWDQRAKGGKSVMIGAAAPAPAANRPAAGSVITLPRIKIGERGSARSATPSSSPQIRGRFASPSEKMRSAKKPAPAPTTTLGMPRNAGAAEVADPSAYFAKLAELARELAATTDVTQLRLLRQRLVEWVEDLRSVGGHDDLARTVETLVRQLPANPGVVAAALEKLAKDGRPGGRVAFWK